jgi:hypothetical protein
MASQVKYQSVAIKVSRQVLSVTVYLHEVSAIIILFCHLLFIRLKCKCFLFCNRIATTRRNPGSNSKKKVNLKGTVGIRSKIVIRKQKSHQKRNTEQ